LKNPKGRNHSEDGWKDDVEMDLREIRWKVVD
jgi:hypothetical protein